MLAFPMHCTLKGSGYSVSKIWAAISQRRNYHGKGVLLGDFEAIGENRSRALGGLTLNPKPKVWGLNPQPKP